MALRVLSDFLSHVLCFSNSLVETRSLRMILLDCRLSYKFVTAWISMSRRWGLLLYCRNQIVDTPQRHPLNCTDNECKCTIWELHRTSALLAWLLLEKRFYLDKQKSNEIIKLKRSVLEKWKWSKPYKPTAILQHWVELRLCKKTEMCFLLLKHMNSFPYLLLLIFGFIKINWFQIDDAL